MVRPLLSSTQVALDTQLLSFIDEFFFDQKSTPPHPLSPRLQRTPSKLKRYRSLWRSAVKRVIKKRSSLQESRSPSVHGVRRKPPAKLSWKLCRTDAPQHDPHDRSCKIDVDLSWGLRDFEVGALDIDLDSSSQDANTLGCHIPDTSLLLSTDSQARILTQKAVASSPHPIPKHSSRKPPRPPRASMSRCGSYRAVRLKTAARRAAIENSRMNKKNLPKSGSSATTVWALIITFCFALIMLVQGFFGNSYKAIETKIESPPFARMALSPTKDLFSIERSTKKHLLEHGAREGWQENRSNLFFASRRGLGVT